MSEERPETCPICHTPVVWCTCKGEKPMDEMGEELYLDEDFRMLAKTYPADVSAIGVTTLIDYVEALDAELARRDEKIAELRNDITGYRRTVLSQHEIIRRLKEDGERLAARPYPFTDVGHIESGTYCHYCHKSNKFDHAPDCPITLHRALMKELE